MYGFVFEAIKQGIQENYSSSVWYSVTETINVPLEFEKFSNYDDSLISDLAKGVSQTRDLSATATLLSNGYFSS